MKTNHRRTQGSFPYFKLAKFDQISMCYRDGKIAFASETDAAASAKLPGKYRISIVHENERQDLAPFHVGT